MARAKRVRETPEVAKGVARMVMALGRRIEDPADLAEFAALRAAIDLAEREAVARQRALGFSWSEIGTGLGTTRQNAQQRFNRKA